MKDKKEPRIIKKDLRKFLTAYIKETKWILGISTAMGILTKSTTSAITTFTILAIIHFFAKFAWYQVDKGMKL